jgi:hypothetical protein
LGKKSNKKKITSEAFDPVTSLEGSGTSENTIGIQVDRGFHGSFRSDFIRALVAVYDDIGETG